MTSRTLPRGLSVWAISVIAVVFGLLTINLIVTPNVRPPLNEAPEPNSLALALVAALALAGVAGSRKA